MHVWTDACSKLCVLTFDASGDDLCVHAAVVQSVGLLVGKRIGAKRKMRILKGVTGALKPVRSTQTQDCPQGSFSL